MQKDCILSGKSLNGGSQARGRLVELSTGGFTFFNFCGRMWVGELGCYICIERGVI